MSKRVLIAVVAGALGVGLAVASPSALTATAAPTASRGPAASAPRVAADPATGVSRVHWHTCQDRTLTTYGLRCGSIRVPLSYARPQGRKITLQLTIRRHTSSARRYLGSLVLDPGGPGGNGMTLPVLQDYVPHRVGYRYDWIGFAPRGVAPSTPTLNCDPSYFGYDRPSYLPTSPRLRRYWKATTTRYARACGTAKAARLLPFMSTEANARDVNAIREALGQRTISYYGFSWGTMLGQTVMTLFPHTLKRVVLDGVEDTRQGPLAAGFDQDRHFDTNMDVFWRWVARHDRTFHLGTSGAAIRRTFYRERRRLVRHPAAHGRLGPDELTDAMLDAGYYVYGWQQDAQMFADLVNKGDGSELLAAYAASSVGKANENGYAAFSAVTCTDGRWPGWAETLRRSRAVDRKAPFETWASTWYSTPCIAWPAPVHAQPRIRPSSALPKILMMSETKDAATPFPGALNVRALFPTSRLIAGVGGTTHASSLSGVSCVDDTIATYLASGKVPARKGGRRADLRCPKLPAPFSAGSPRASTDDALLDVAHAALEAAQRSETR